MIHRENNLYTEISDQDHLSAYSSILGRPINVRKSYLCPFHNEKTASLHFIKKNNKMYYKCFGCGKGGDIFRFVMEYYHVDFCEALKVLASVYNIYVAVPAKNHFHMPNLFINEDQEEELFCDVHAHTSTEWRNQELQWFDTFKINKDYLPLHGISSLRNYKMIWYNAQNESVRRQHKVVPAPAFYIRYPEKGIFQQKCKLYFPGKKPKMLGTATEECIFGTDFMKWMVTLNKPKYIRIVFLSGIKDVLVMNSFAYYISGLYFLCTISENVLPSTDFIERLKMFCNNVEFNYYMDNDDAGYKAEVKWQTTFPWIEKFKGFERIDLHMKDPGEMFENLDTANLTKTIKQNLNEYYSITD